MGIKGLKFMFSHKKLIMFFIITYFFIGSDVYAEGNSFPDIGNVGIGTKDPEAQLHIIDNDIPSSPQLRLQDSKRLWNIWGGENFIIQQKDENIIFLQGNTGNVGIATNNPEARLEVKARGADNKGLIGTSHDGVYGESTKTGGSGVAGIFNGAGGGNGVYGRYNPNGDYGILGSGYGAVFGHSKRDIAVRGYSDEGTAIRGKAGGNFAKAIHGEATGEKGVGIYAKGGPNGYGGVFLGNVVIKTLTGYRTLIELGEGLDFAEGFNVSEVTHIKPGSVLVIDPDHPGKLVMSNIAYDSKVAGIVAGANGQGSGVRLGADHHDFDVALAGRVFCNVDAFDAAIKPGDLLTTSETPGFAMKASDHSRAHGSILGKAMEPMKKGTRGQILVLVTLQ
jgi:hypothetical protein